MTAWKTRPRFAVSSSAPRCEPSSFASASVSGVKPEMSANSAEPSTRSGISRWLDERPAPVPGDVRLGIVAGQVDGALDGGGSSDCSALCGSLSMRHAGAPVHSARDRPRLPPLARSRPAGRGRGARDSTIRDAAGREYLDAAGGAIVVNVGHGRRVDRRRSSAEQAGPPRVRPRQRVHDRAASRRTPREVGPDPAGRRPGDLPGQRRLGGDRDRAEAGRRLPPGSRRGRSLDRHLALGQLPRQHARRARPVGPAAAPPAVRGLAGPVPARVGGLPVSRRRARRARRSATGPELAAELERTIEAAGPGTVAAFVAEPIVGATLAAAVPPDDYWPLDRGGLPPPRRAAHRRRGDDRVRADGALVRARPLGRPRRHPRRGQGRDLRLLAVRVRRGVRRDPRRGDWAPAGSSTASRTPTRRAARPSPGRCSGSSTRRTSSRPAAVKGERLADLLHERLAPHPTSARSAAGA